MWENETLLRGGYTGVRLRQESIQSGGRDVDESIQSGGTDIDDDAQAFRGTRKGIRRVEIE